MATVKYDQVKDPNAAARLASQASAQAARQQVMAQSVNPYSQANFGPSSRTTGLSAAAKSAVSGNAQPVNLNAYNAAVNKAQGNVTPAYTGTYEDQLNDIYNQIQNREKFSYDVNADPLYNAYKDKYVQQGKMAMQDTMGRAAALTGGYGSSYSQQVGQQTYNAYLQNLTDAIPELYSMALSQYQDEGNRLKDLYGMASAASEREYSRGRDAIADERYAQELARQQEQQDYERQIYADNLEYNKMQDAKKNVLAMIQLGATPTDAELAAAGITRAQADAIHAQLFPAPAAVGAGGGGGSGGGKPEGGNGNMKAYDIGVQMVADQVSNTGNVKDAGVAAANVFDKADKSDLSQEERQQIYQAIVDTGKLAWLDK